ncbi:MAG: tRNA adenosine(34) deaminase TadA [Deltaproteobacteria bacterium]
MDNKYMEIALQEARKAYKKGEAPVGAVIVRDDEIIAKTHNLRESRKEPTAHAEILAIKKAAKKLNAWRLSDCDLYVTLEPCPMCAGAIVQSKIRRLYYGAYDARAGAAGSVINLFENNFNHKVEVYEGIMEEECAEILRVFFKELRRKA